MGQRGQCVGYCDPDEAKSGLANAMLCYVDYRLCVNLSMRGIRGTGPGLHYGYCRQCVGSHQAMGMQWSYANGRPAAFACCEVEVGRCNVMQRNEMRSVSCLGKETRRDERVVV
jgi:hypothetical protein